jgi:hypothetical protein
MDIKGEADLCMRFFEVPGFVLEVMALSATCDSPFEREEVLTETKGFAEEFCTKMNAAPLEFQSLLACIWQMFFICPKIVAEDGNAVYLMSY